MEEMLVHLSFFVSLSWNSISFQWQGHWSFIHSPSTEHLYDRHKIWPVNLRSFTLMGRDRCKQITTRLLDMFWCAQHEMNTQRMKKQPPTGKTGDDALEVRNKSSAERSLIPSFYLCLTDRDIINCACLKYILWYIVCMCLDIWIHENPP